MAGVKLIVMYPTPKEPTFERVYQDEHVPMGVKKLAGKTKLVATKVQGSPRGKPAFYRIAEVHFPSLQALEACAASAGGKETLAHAAKLSSGGPPVILIAEEQTFRFSWPSSTRRRAGGAGDKDEHHVSRVVAVQRCRAAAPPPHGCSRVFLEWAESSQGSCRALQEHRCEPRLYGLSRERGSARQHRGGLRDLDPTRCYRVDAHHARGDPEEDLRVENGLLGRERVRLALRSDAAADEPRDPPDGRWQARCAIGSRVGRAPALAARTSRLSSLGSADPMTPARIARVVAVEFWEAVARTAFRVTTGHDLLRTCPLGSAARRSCLTGGRDSRTQAVRSLKIGNCGGQQKRAGSATVPIPRDT